MRTGWGWGAAIAFAFAAAPPLASAHDLKCDKTVRLVEPDGGDATAAVDGVGQKIVEVRQYPATLEYTWTVTNLHPFATSIAQWEMDSLLFPYRVIDVPVADDTPYVGHELFTIGSYEECLDLAGGTPVIWASSQPIPPWEIGLLDNRYAVGFEQGEAQCTARVLCYPPKEECEGGATRTMGFFKTHIGAADACLESGPIDLGFASVDTMAEFMGLLWDSPSSYDGLAKATFLVARQLEVAVCNERLFHTDSGGLTEAARAALGLGMPGTFADLLDAFNNSGDDVSLPPGLDIGPATPREAEALAGSITIGTP